MKACHCVGSNRSTGPVLFRAAHEDRFVGVGNLDAAAIVAVTGVAAGVLGCPAACYAAADGTTFPQVIRWSDRKSVREVGPEVGIPSSVSLRDR